jgi:CBS-domain-containing membrane protein
VNLTNPTKFRQTLADVMTTPVVTARPTTPYKELVGLLSGHRVGALPVVDDEGRVVGVVSEADLMTKSARPEPAPRWRPSARGRQRKATGTTAAAVMSSPVVTADLDTPVVRAARLMQEHDVKHLPVLDGEDRLAGIVSRGDLLKPFLRSDADIRKELVETVLTRWLWIDPATVEVSVSHGEVSLTGQVDRRSDVDVITHIVSRLDGVVGVQSRLTFGRDDVHERQHPSEARVT